MTRHPVIRIRESRFNGDPCFTAGWCCNVDNDDPAWVGFTFGTSADEAFAFLAVCSALRAQPASGNLLRAVLGELAGRPGLVRQAIDSCEIFARNYEKDAVSVYEKDTIGLDADNLRANRYASAAMCRQIARLLQELAP